MSNNIDIIAIKFAAFIQVYKIFFCLRLGTNCANGEPFTDCFFIQIYQEYANVVSKQTSIMLQFVRLKNITLS